MTTSASPAVRNSTTVRFIRGTGQDRVRAAFEVLDRYAPPVAAWWAERLWFSVPSPPLSARRQDDAPGEPFELTVNGRRVDGEAWGSGPVVYLLHGWGGWRGQLSSLVSPLVGSGFRVVAFDAPSHGESAPGVHGPKRATLLDFTQALAAAIDAHGPAYAVVTHSGGTVGVGAALRLGIGIDRLVLVAPMATPMTYFEPFAGVLGLGARTRDLLLRRIVRRVGLPLSHFDIRTVGDTEPTPPTLIIHDRDDAEIPWSDGQAIASSFPDARLVTTTGLGHRRILRDPDVVAEIVAFVAAGSGLGDTAHHGNTREERP